MKISQNISLRQNTTTAVGINTEKDRKGPKRTEKGPKRTEKHVLLYYLPKRRRKVADRAKKTTRQQAWELLGGKATSGGVIAYFSDNYGVLFCAFSVIFGRVNQSSKETNSLTYHHGDGQSRVR